MLTLKKRNANQENKVSPPLMEQDLDLGSAAESPFGASARLGFQQGVVDDRSIGRQILQHQDRPLIEIDAKVNVAESSKWVVLKADIASAGISSESETLHGVLDVCREPQGDMMLARVLLNQTKIFSFVLQRVIHVEPVRIIAP